MGWWDDVKAHLGDALKAALRNPGDVSGTLHDQRQQREEREAEERLRRYEQEMARLAVQAVLEGLNRTVHKNHGQRITQFKDEDVTVEVRSGWSHDLDRATTDIVVAPRERKDGAHFHFVFDDMGNVIFQEWREKR